MPITPGQEAFRTHYNYIHCLKDLIQGTTLNYPGIGQIIQAPLPFLDRKRNFIDLTRRSINDEARIVRLDAEYSYASTSWLPIKSYYLLFNLMLTIDYLITLDERAFRNGHARCSSGFTEKLETGKIVFGEPLLNIIYDQGIFSYRPPSGTNLRQTILRNSHRQQVMKKIAQYKLEEWQRSRAIPSFKSLRNRQAKSTYLDTFKLSIFEFPYYMRLRANYRDFAFIDGVTALDTRDYFNDYFTFSVGLYRALNGLKNQLYRARTT